MEPVTLFGYAILAFVSSVVLALFAITLHLIKFVWTERKRPADERQQVVCFAITTFLGLVAFEIALALMIAITVEFLYVQSNQHNAAIDFLSRTHLQLEYLIPLFDAIGHIFILIVLIRRFQISFTNTIFGDFSRIVRFMKLFVAFSTTMTIATVIFIIWTNNTALIMTTEIVWELTIEMMCLFLLYLFVTKLFVLLRWSLKCVNPLQSDLTLFREFKDSMGPKLERRRSAITASSVTNSPPGTDSSHPSDASVTGGSSTRTQSAEHPVDPQSHQNMELLNVMIKLTLLILICVLTSVLSVAGNIALKIRWMDRDTATSMDIKMVSLYILPTIDVLTTSLMVYLQFNFAENIYLKICGKMDTVCLRCGLWFVRRVLIPSKPEDELAENTKSRENASTLELSTDPTAMQRTSTLDSETTSKTPDHQSMAGSSTSSMTKTITEIEIVFEESVLSPARPSLRGNGQTKLPDITEAVEPSVSMEDNGAGRGNSQ